jgi:hypothetical protein
MECIEMKRYPGISHNDPHIRASAIAANSYKSRGMEDHFKPSTKYENYLKEHESPHWGKGEGNKNGDVK